MSEKKEKPLWVPQIAVIAVIGFGLAIEGEGGYFNLARWIVCPVLAFVAYHFYEAKKMPWVWVFGILAGVFNPIVPVRMEREIWLLVDWLLIAMCGTSVLVFISKSKAINALKGFFAISAILFAFLTMAVLGEASVITSNSESVLARMEQPSYCPPNQYYSKRYGYVNAEADGTISFPTALKMVMRDWFDAY